MGDRRLSPLAICLGLSLGVHVALVWILVDRATVRTIDFGEESVVSVRLFTPTPPAPVASPPPQPAESRPPEPAPPPPQPAAEPAVEPQIVAPPEPTPPPAEVAAVTPSEIPPLPAVSAAAPPESVTIAPSGTQRDEIAEYVETVNALIRDQKRYPKLARKRKIEGRVLVVVEIAADGQLSALTLRDDAPRVLGRATEAAIRRAAPFPTPPGGAKTIEIELEYMLRDVS